MADVTIYTTGYCPYCAAAKSLLERRRIAYREIDVTSDEAERARLVARSGGRQTVPQIFVDGEAIGGYDELAALEREGRLEALLAGE